MVCGFGLALAFGAAGACSGGSDGPGGTDDAGNPDNVVPPDVQVDAPVVDATIDASEDAPADATDSDAATVKALKLRDGATVFHGLTDDGYVVYEVMGPASSSLEAASVAGGPPIAIATLVPSSYATTSGSAVAFWTARAGELGTLSVWTKAGGLKTNIATASSVNGFSASHDGTRIAFRFDGTATTTSFAVTSAAAPATTAGAETAVISVAAAGSSCPPQQGFVGSAFFVAYCPFPIGAGNARLATVPAVANPPVLFLANTETLGQTILPFWRSDKAGSKVFVLSPGKQARIVDVAAPSTDAVAIDDDVAAPPLAGFLTDDGAGLVYQTSSLALKRSATAAPLPFVLVGADVRTFEPSPSKSLVTITTQLRVGGGKNPASDLLLADTTTPAQTPVTIVPTATGGFAAFAASSSHVFYFSDIPESGALKGTLHVRAIGAGALPRQVAADVGVVPSVRTVGTGARIAFMDHLVGGGTGIAPASGDIETFDAASVAPPKLLVAGAEAFVVYESKVIYWTPAPNAAMWVVDVP